VAKRGTNGSTSSQDVERLERICRGLARRLEDVETEMRGYGRTLDVQFKRIATIQGELDMLLAERRRTG
jgi:hypothetical protein